MTMTSFLRASFCSALIIPTDAGEIHWGGNLLDASLFALDLFDCPVGGFGTLISYAKGGVKGLLPFSIVS